MNFVSRFRPALAGLMLSALAYSAQAQLAITEAMSSASTNLGPALVTQNSDFWELTNFGTNTIDLTGYRFDDSDNNLAAADSTPFAGLSIGPNESILFVQSSPNTNDLSVREWWGANLPATAKIVFYTGNGFSSGGDGIRLWSPAAQTASEVTDSVDFGEAARGFTFTYDPQTGAFGILSTNGANGAFKAATSDDVGSPGKNAGPAPLAITQQPQSVVVNPGDTARFTVAVRGLPRGSIQWHFKNAPISGATGATLEVTDVQADDTGLYHAVIQNGIQTVTSAQAELVLQTQASAPVITASPEDFTLTVGQSWTFNATATGVPQPVFEWQIEGRVIPGFTTGELALSGATEADSGLYSVIARNSVGSATNTFRVTVTPPPQLVITEVMSSSSTNAPGHADWWELSNLGSFPVSLKGYRFDDSSETLGSSFTFTNDVVIQPGESVIFSEGMTLEEFKAWWGADNLPAGLKLLTYSGNGLSSGGDAVNVWNAAATEDSEKAASAVFSTSTAGVSFGYDPDAGQFGALSVAGTHGAFIAVSGGDIGSPGYIRNTPRPVTARFTEIARTQMGARLVWTSEAGRSYTLQAAADLSGAAWTTVTTVNATGASASFEEAIPAGVSQRFYRVSTTP